MQPDRPPCAAPIAARRAPRRAIRPTADRARGRRRGSRDGLGRSGASGADPRIADLPRRLSPPRAAHRRGGSTREIALRKATKAALRLPLKDRAEDQAIEEPAEEPPAHFVRVRRRELDPPA